MRHHPVKIVLLLAAAAWQSATGGAELSGRVYLDRNGSRAPDAGEPGIAGVAVSDGTRVVATDANGRWRLEVGQGPVVIWVSLPRDHAAGDSFWRAADGRSPVDFPLVRKAQPDDFAFVQITDTHVGRADLVAEFGERISKFPARVAFVVNTGDLVGGVDVVLPEKARSQFDAYRGAAAAFKVPLWNLPGNHEHVAFHVKEADKSHPYYGKGLYRQVLGPMHYSWDFGPIHFIALDGTSLPYREKLGREQLAWLEADLALQPADKPLVLFCHQSIPKLVDAGDLAARLAGRRVLAAFCGHLHATFATEFAGFPVIHTGALGGSWWSGANPDGTPQGFRLVQVRDGALTSAYFQREGPYSLAVVNPRACDPLCGSVEFEVNVLDFGRPVELVARFDGRRAPIELASRDELWSAWRGTFDSRQAFDGDRVLKVSSQLGNEMSWTETRYLVLNHRPEPYKADSDALVKLQVRAVNAANEVLLNGEPLGIIPADAPKDAVLEFPVPQVRLAKVNRLTLRAAPERGKDLDDFSVGPISLTYRRRAIHDLRYPAFERHLIGDANPAQFKPQRELFFCLP